MAGGGCGGESGDGGSGRVCRAVFIREDWGGGGEMGDLRE